MTSLQPLVDGMVGRLGDLAAVLRAQGTRVGVGELLAAVRSLEGVDCASRDDVRFALRTVLCSQHADLERFDLAFVAVYGDGSVPSSDDADPLGALGHIERPAPLMGLADPGGGVAEDESEVVPAAWSDIELLREKDFARYTEAEMALARELIQRLARRHPMRLSRRTRPSRRREHVPDLRATVYSSLRTGGEPLHRRWRAPTERPRQMVLVCDVSGSMAPYSRMLLQYMHASVAAQRRVEAFAFGTRLTRITQELAGRDHDRALDRATAAVNGLLGRHAHRGRDRRAQPGARPPDRPRARWSSCCPTGGIAGSPSSSTSRWRGCAGPPTGSCGSTPGRASGLPAAGARDAGRGAAHRPAAGRQFAGVAGGAGDDPGGDVGRTGGRDGR